MIIFDKRQVRVILLLRRKHALAYGLQGLFALNDLLFTALVKYNLFSPVFSLKYILGDFVGSLEHDLAVL